MDRVVARVNDMRNAWLFTEAWGVDVAVSAPAALVAAIEGAIDIGHVVRLMELRQGQVSLAKLTLPEGDPLVGQRMRDVPLLENTVLAIVIRDSRLMPSSSTIASRERSSSSTISMRVLCGIWSVEMDTSCIISPHLTYKAHDFVRQSSFLNAAWRMALLGPAMLVYDLDGGGG